MNRILLPAILLTLGATALSAQGAALGDPAPPITIEHWIKGAPVKVGRGTNLYVVEFWAIWCGPCKSSIPHLTALQSKYARNGVVFIGISDEPAEDLVPFVASQGNNMQYRVANDTSKRTINSWMPAYGAHGIPHAFIVVRSPRDAEAGAGSVQQPQRPAATGTVPGTIPERCQITARKSGCWSDGEITQTQLPNSQTPKLLNS